jgi:threonine/homoserine/homoserine lactone efflux protein
MKIFLMILLAILALNALVIVGVAVILWLDHWKSKRRKGRDDDAHARAS